VQVQSRHTVRTYPSHLVDWYSQGMPNQIILEWEVDVSGSSFGPAEAEAKLGAVPLYRETEADPVLGQLFGLTVESDVTAIAGSTVSRTLTLAMNSNGTDPAPPIFECRQRPQSNKEDLEIEPPYPLTENKTLPGSFFVENGLFTVPTTMSQVPSLNVGDLIQFLSQATFYEVAIVAPTMITLTDAYSGTTTNTGAFKEVPAPVALDRLAVYSSSPLDTNGVATSPAIPAGPGARAVEVQYLDSTGAGPFEAEADLTGKRPATFVFDEPAGIDVATIISCVVSDVGSFENSVGQITLVELSDALPAIPPNTIPGTGIGIIEGTSQAIGFTNTFVALTDEAQLLIERPLVYLPPSYFALAAQQAAAPPLEGDFLVTTDSTEVFTTEDQTGVLIGGDSIEFAVQPGTIYEIEAVTERIVKLTTIFTGIDTNNTGLNNTPVNNATGTKGNIGDKLIQKPTGARSASIGGAPPTNAELAAPLAQFVAPAVTMPPANPPHTVGPGTVPTPEFLSGLFTQTLQLALAGVPITPVTVAFA